MWLPLLTDEWFVEEGLDFFLGFPWERPPPMDAVPELNLFEAAFNAEKMRPVLGVVGVIKSPWEWIGAGEGAVPNVNGALIVIKSVFFSLGCV